MPTPEQTLERVRGLIALAGSPNEHEAAAAAAKAAELIQKYGLDLAEIGKSDPTVVCVVASYQSARRQVWEVELAAAVGRAFLCKALTSKLGMHFYGAQLDADAAAMTYNNLAKRLVELAYVATQGYVKEATAKYGVSPRYLTGELNFKHWRHSWLYGAVDGIRQALAAQTESNKNASALVVVRQAEIDEYVAKTVKPGTYNSGDASVNGEAFGKGKETGKTMGIQKGLN